MSLKKPSGADATAEKTDDAAAGRVRQYLTFRLGFELFAVPILSILEIIEYQPPVPVPGLPSLFCGVIDLRESAVPVIELASCLSRSVGAVTKRSCILIVETQSHARHRRVGFIVDSVDEVMDIAAEAIDAPPVIGSMAAEPYLLGTGRLPRDPFDLDNTGVVVLIDFEPLITMFAGTSLGGLEAA